MIPELRYPHQPELLGAEHHGVLGGGADLRGGPLPRPQLHQHGAVPRRHRHAPLQPLPRLRGDTPGAVTGD